jgi:replication factor C subunit 2/4
MSAGSSVNKPRFQTQLFGQDILFQSIRDSLADIPHLFMTGPPGSGKTTFVYDFISLCRAEAPFQIESVLYLSSEKDRGIHTIRDKVNDFCKRAHKGPNMLRWIVIDDADTLPLISQQALRRPMEQYSHLTRFLFASRHANHLIEPLRSRCLTLELEPIYPIDAYPRFLSMCDVPKEAQIPQLQDFIFRNFLKLHEIKTILSLYSAKIKEGCTTKDAIKSLHCLLPNSLQYINALIQSLSEEKGHSVRHAVTQLYLAGYLLDDILLGIEKGIGLFPSINPDIRFRILHFTMLGWISIQQGKEHWLDAMDIVTAVCP